MRKLSNLILFRIEILYLHLNNKKEEKLLIQSQFLFASLIATLITPASENLNFILLNPINFNQF